MFRGKVLLALATFALFLMLQPGSSQPVKVKFCSFIVKKPSTSQRLQKSMALLFIQNVLKIHIAR